MKWISTKVMIESEDPATAAELVAALFWELAVGGVVMEEPLDAEEEDWADDSPPFGHHYSVTGYFHKNRYIHEQQRLLEDGLARLSKRIDLQYRFVFQELDEEDWAESWKAYFWPEKIGRRIVVKPTWREYDKRSPDEIVCQIDPGMAFGTGTHPSTALCIRLLETHIHSGDRFLDIGTGSGILLVTAAKLGAAYICGIDKDPIAIEIAEKNLMVNGIAPESFSLVTGSLTRGISKRFTVVAANILTDTILDLLQVIGSVLEPGAVFICSGITTSHSEKVRTAMSHGPWNNIQHNTEDGWVAIAARWHPNSPLKTG